MDNEDVARNSELKSAKKPVPKKQDSYDEEDSDSDSGPNERSDTLG